VAAVIVWKSTAIFVQMTSRPPLVRGPRLGQVCGDNMSEAVRSNWRGSFGAIAMRLHWSQEDSCGCRSTVCHINPSRNSNASHTSSRPHLNIHLDSRTSCKEYKLSDCINRASAKIRRTSPPQRPANIYAAAAFAVSNRRVSRCSISACSR
jgi:hypothetical protein